MTSREKVRAVLDMMRIQVEMHLPRLPDYVYGGTPEKLPLDELGRVAVVVREYLRAERDYAELLRASGVVEMTLIPQDETT